MIDRIEPASSSGEPGPDLGRTLETPMIRTLPLALLLLAPASLAATRGGLSGSIGGTIGGTTTGTYADPGPTAPSYPTLLDREATSVAFRWINKSTVTASWVEWRTATVPWTTLRALGAQTANTPTTVEALPVPADTWSCLRARVSNAWGSATSSEVCFYTLDGRDNAFQRVQLELETSQGFSPSVSVSLELPWYADQYEGTKNHTWVIRDTHGAGTLDTFDLRTTGLHDQSEIHRILLTPESGSFCARHLGLRIDDVLVWERDWATCRTVSATSPLLVTHEELRASPTWLSAPVGDLDPFTYEEVAGTIDATVGDTLHDAGGVWWRGRPTVDRKDDYTLGVFLPLSSSWGALDGTFDLVFTSTCNADGDTELEVHAENVDIDAASWWNVAAWIASEIAESEMPDVRERVLTVDGCDREFYLAPGVGVLVRSL